MIYRCSDEKQRLPFIDDSILDACETPAAAVTVRDMIADSKELSYCSKSLA